MNSILELMKSRNKNVAYFLVGERISEGEKREKLYELWKSDDGFRFDML